MIDLSIITVSWNVADLLDACLQSILAGPLYVVAPGQAPPSDNILPTAEIIIVESASTDHTAEVLARYPQVKVLPQATNVGFTRSNNIGLAAARGRFVMLLNPDTEVQGDALAVLVAYLDAHPDVGIVGPHTLNTDGSTQGTRRRFPTFATAIFESTWLQRYAPPRVLKRYYVEGPPDDAVIDVDWVQGSALMARREAYQKIGPLDETYIMFSEEMDWCKRAKDVGWRVVYVGTAKIVHHGGKSTDQVVAKRHIYFQQSKVHYFYKHHGNFVGEILRVFLLIQYMQQWLIEWLKGRLGLKPDLRWERTRAYRAVLRSGLWPPRTE